jgi:hypothetical protein
MTPATVQTLVVILIIAAALLYLGRRFRRTLAASRARKKGEAACGVGCGCETAGETRMPAVKARK